MKDHLLYKEQNIFKLVKRRREYVAYAMYTLPKVIRCDPTNEDDRMLRNLQDIRANRKFLPSQELWKTERWLLTAGGQILTESKNSKKHLPRIFSFGTVICCSSDADKFYTVKKYKWSFTMTASWICMISSSSSSYRAGSTDIPDPLSPLLPIVHRPR